MSSPVVVKLVFMNEVYHVHMTVNYRGWEGYVVKDGSFFCAVPNAASKSDLLDLAGQRIEDLTRH